MKSVAFFILKFGFALTAMWGVRPSQGLHTRFGTQFPEVQNRGFRLTHQYFDYYDSWSESWHDDQRYDFHYPDALNARFDSLYCLYNYCDQGFFLDWEADCHYDAQGYMTNWNIPSVWDDVRSYNLIATSSFDADHRLIMSQWYMEDDLNPDYSYVYHRLIPIYDGPALVAISSFGDDSRQDYARWDYLHDAQGRIITVTISESEDSLTFNPVEMAEITYHPSDTGTMADFILNLTRKESANVDYYSPDDRYMGYYGKPGQILFYQMDAPERQWELYGRELHFYDANGDLDYYSYDEYNDGTWEPYDLTEYYYDANRNVIMIEYWEESWDRPMEAYERHRFEWETYTANEDPVASPSRLNAYPNPFREELTIQLKSEHPAEVRLYNLRGQKVLSELVSGTDKLNWQTRDLPSGVYLVTVKQDGRTANCKVMLMK